MKKLILVLFLGLSACASVPSYYLEADRQTYNAVSKDLETYYKEDPILQKYPDDLKIKLDTLASWKFRLDHYSGIAPVESK